MLLGISSLILACGSSDLDIQDSVSFYESNETEIHNQIRSRFLKRNYFWVAHIHFWGNDFGDLTSVETETELFPESMASEKKFYTGFPIPDEGLYLDHPAVWIRNFPREQEKLFSVRYRHPRYQEAIEDMTRIFQCHDGQSLLASRTLFLGSGGSHGAYALSKFGKAFRKECGKGFDFALVGDAIAQPFVLPMKSFEGLDSDGICINFYQRAIDQIVKGAAIKQCRNYKSLSEGHKRLDAQAAWLSRIILDDIRF